jgi:hypothetical protein
MHRLPPIQTFRVAFAPLAPLLVLSLLAPSPAAAQTADDWSTAPLAIPANPGAVPAPGAAAEPPPRQVQQPPPELLSPQAPLLPGQEIPPPRVTPSVRIAPGSGVRPRPTPAPVRPPAAAPVRPPFVARPTPGLPPAPSSLPKPPGPSEAELARLRAQLRQARTPPVRQRVPSFLETLPPGTIRPLPGEVLPGSQAPAGAAPGGLRDALPALPRPPRPPQVVPPPPWADRKQERPLQNTPLAWLLLGLGLGGTGVFLLQERRRRPPLDDPLATLGIRVLPRPDAGEQTLRPAERPAAAPLE